MSIDWQKSSGPEMQLSDNNQSDYFFDSTVIDRRSSFNDFASIIPKRRIYLIILFFIFISSVLLFRLFNYQIVHGVNYAQLAERNRERTIITPSRRGVIVDRNGVVLAENIPAFQLITTPAFRLSDDNRKLELIELLYKHIPAQYAEILNQNKDNIGDLIIMENIDHDKAMELFSLLSEIPELKIEQISQRNYLTDTIPSLSHVLGYTGKMSENDILNNPDYRRIDLIGKTGIESIYERELRGEPGRENIEVDSRGRVQRITSTNQAIDGQNIELTIDSKLQSFIEEVLIRLLPQVEATRASVVALNPENGEVLALVSWPAYDANNFIGGISAEDYNALIENEDNPLFHRAIAGEFPSGSTIKPIYAAAALVENIVNANTSFPSRGGLQIGPWFFPDWRSGGHGITNVYHAIADSVNTYFYIIGGGYDTVSGLGISGLMKYAELFGLGNRSGIDQVNERSGFLPNPEWKQRVKGEQWYIGDTYNVSIGQGDLLATPLQIARANAVFANDGYLINPHLRLGSNENDKVRIIDTETAMIVKNAMRRTVTNGTASILQNLSLDSAGKTGTAQWSSNRKNHSWYVGFLPLNEPELLITVLVEEDGNRGLSVSISREIMQFWIDEIR